MFFLEGSWNRRSSNKKELNIVFTSSLLKTVSHDSQFNLSIKSDIVYLLIFVMVFGVCVGARE